MRLPFRHTGKFLLLALFMIFYRPQGSTRVLWGARPGKSTAGKNLSANSHADCYQKVYGSGKRRVRDLWCRLVQT